MLRPEGLDAGLQIIRQRDEAAGQRLGGRRRFPRLRQSRSSAWWLRWRAARARRSSLPRRSPRRDLRPCRRRGRRRPAPAPRSASRISPPSAMRRTACAPKRRTARCVPDQPGTTPIEVSGKPSFMCRSATRKSAAAASSSPPPSAWPDSTAMVGWRSRASRSKTRWPKRTHFTWKSAALIADQASTSPPAQKPLPSPAAARPGRLRRLGLVERRCQRLQHRDVERVEFFRPAQRDRADRAVLLEGDETLSHAPLHSSERPIGASW